MSDPVAMMRLHPRTAGKPSIRTTVITTISACSEAPAAKKHTEPERYGGP